jgi:hypothetical protein
MHGSKLFGGADAPEVVVSAYKKLPIGYGDGGLRSFFEIVPA